jgi:hypothetical protein
LITAVAAAASLIPASGAFAGTLDQQQTVSNFGGLQVANNNSKAQTFTAGLTGVLDQLDLALSGGVDAIAPITVQIRDGSPTAPGETILASASVPTSAATSSESWVSIPFASPASVTAGTQYSIVLLNADASSAFGWFWYAGKTATGPTSAYEGGTLYSSPDAAPGPGDWFAGNALADFEFKTYVGPPPPPPPPPGTGDGGGSAVAPIATGQRAAALKKCKKKRSQKAKRKCRKKAAKKPV